METDDTEHELFPGPERATTARSKWGRPRSGEQLARRTRQKQQIQQIWGITGDGRGRGAAAYLQSARSRLARDGTRAAADEAVESSARGSRTWRAQRRAWQLLHRGVWQTQTDLRSGRAAARRPFSEPAPLRPPHLRCRETAAASHTSTQSSYSGVQTDTGPRPAR